MPAMFRELVDMKQDSQAEGTPVSVKIRERLKQAQKRFHANDNISEFIEPGELELLLDEVQRSEEHTSELQSPCNLVCRLLLEKKKKKEYMHGNIIEPITILVMIQ